MANDSEIANLNYEINLINMKIDSVNNLQESAILIEACFNKVIIGDKPFLQEEITRVINCISAVINDLNSQIKNLEYKKNQLIANNSDKTA